MKNKEFSFIGHNLAKFNTFWQKNGSAVLIYNLSFKATKNNPTAFVFSEDSLTKKAMINIFKGNDQNYSGFFEYQNKIYFSKSKELINDIIALIDMEDFYRRNMQSKNIQFFKQNKFLRKIENNLINFNKNFGQNFDENKNQSLFDLKKIDLETSQKVNNEITKMIEILDDVLAKLKFKNSKLKSVTHQKEALELIRNFYHRYETYLTKRIELLYQKNNQIIHYLSKENKVNDVINLDLTAKINSLSKEINFKKISAKEQNKLNFQQLQEDLNEIKNKNLMILKIKQNDFKFFVKKHKFHIDSNDKNNNINTTKHLYKLNTNLFFINFIKKYSRKILYLNSEQMNTFIDEINGQYNLALFEVNTFIKNSKNINNRKAMEQWISSIFKLDINYFVTSSAANYKQIVDQLKTEDEDELISENKLNWDNNLEWKKVQYQNLCDEYNWIQNNSVVALNKKIVQLNLEAHKNISDYKNLRMQIDQKLSEFIKLRNYVIDHLSDQNDQLEWSKDHSVFKVINEEYLRTFNLLKSDSIQIEAYLKDHSDLLRENDYKLFLIEQKVYNLLHFCGLDDEIVEKTFSQLTNLEIAKLFLVEAVLSNKPIIVVNNFLHYLSPEQHQIFISLYKKIEKLFPRIWIHLADSFAEIAPITSYVNIMKEGVNIEFGNVHDIYPNPFYQLSSDLLNPQKEAKDYPYQPLIFDSTNKKFFYDYYKLNDDHCVYASIVEIYQQRKQIPIACKWTLNPLKIEEFKNHLMQQVNPVAHNKEFITAKILEFQEQERIIIDVRENA